MDNRNVERRARTLKALKKNGFINRVCWKVIVSRRTHENIYGNLKMVMGKGNKKKEKCEYCVCAY